jgi:hypothetical protein
MSAARRGGRFSYLTSAPESAQKTLTEETEEQRQEAREPEDVSAGESLATTDRSSDREEGNGPRPSTEDLVSVPKGQGRMKQERSQLNVRIPTTLKRQASAKAVLEGRDIGEVVEALLREYLER